LSPRDEGGETAARFALLPRLPSDESGPVFAEPWQAQAFALAVQLHAAGAFSWSEWAAALSAQLKSADDDGTHYYEHWLAALECLVGRRGLAAPEELASRKEAWADAYRRTPHGRPVEL
jgi:nitrile hydratase accessory protein